jgi:hypothetical protein
MVSWADTSMGHLRDVYLATPTATVNRDLVVSRIFSPLRSPACCYLRRHDLPRQ